MGLRLQITLTLRNTFVFFHMKENEPKENSPYPAIPPGLPCASPMWPEHAETRFAQTVRVLFTGHLVDARRGTKGYENRRMPKHL